MDSAYLFDTYLDSVQKYKQGQAVFQPTRDSIPSPLFVDLLSKERVGVAPTTGMSNMANMAQAAQQAQPQDFAAGAA
jgi:carbamoyl-phosphate synthase small subunit